jgi:hypothetical protein
MQTTEFDLVLRWLGDRVGQEICVSLQGTGDRASNTSLSARGRLSVLPGEVAWVDPAPGRVEAFDVGSSTLVLLEGDLVEVDVQEGEAVQGADGAFLVPAMLSADFGELSVTFADP